MKFNHGTEIIGWCYNKHGNVCNVIAPFTINELIEKQNSTTGVVNNKVPKLCRKQPVKKQKAKVIALQPLKKAA